MTIAGHCGAQILIDEKSMPTSDTADVLEYLFNEELVLPPISHLILNYETLFES